jgi:uncharacterized protein YjiS (DUF1127 family)
MLYRPQPRSTAALVIRAVFAGISGVIGQMRQTNADTAYLESTTAHMLNDLGLRRCDDDRNRHFY